MPNCFQLLDKETKEPQSLNRIDEEICELLDKPVHPNLYCEGWFDCVGVKLACGKSWDQIVEDLEKIQEDSSPNHWPTKMLKVVAYLRERYDATSWYQVHK